MLECWFFLLVLAALSQNLSVHSAGKNVLSLVKRIRASAGTLCWCFIYLFESLVNEKKQRYTFNNSSILQMLGKDHVLFLKKILKFKIFRLSVCSLYNSESDPKNFQLLDNNNHQIV